MAKGYDTNQQRKQSLSLFGKDLARRAKSRCELSHESGVPLVTYEIPPVPNEPDYDRCLLVSEAVRAQLEKPSTIRPEAWRHLSELIWTDLQPAQVMALRILRHLAPTHPWAQNLIDEASFDPEVEALADQAKL
jgi:protein PhnA